MILEDEYIEKVFQSLSEDCEDFPLYEEQIIIIVSTQLFNNNIPLKNACSFARILLFLNREEIPNIISFNYKPLDVLKVQRDFLWEYSFEYCHSFETVLLKLKNNKYLIISQSDALSIKDLKRKIKELML